MTQQELADRLGLSSPYIAQMESGFKPPPPNMLVDKITNLLHLKYEERKRFIESAEKQRELQSLVKATRKIGYILAGNKVCVPQKAVSYRVQQEIDELVDAIPRTISFVVDHFDGVHQSHRAHSTLQNLKTHDDIRSWALTELGDLPSVWLAFLGGLYDVLMLTPDERLLTRHDTKQRESILSNAIEVGTFFGLLRDTIEDAKHKAVDHILPDVIAPHEAWRKMDEVLGEPPNVELIPKQIEGKGDGESIRSIPVVGEIKPGTDEFDEAERHEFLGLPIDWFNTNREYEACFVQSDAYVSIGIWPGCKVVYELDGNVDNEDIVVARIGDRRCLRKYFDMGEQMMLLGGPLSRPIQVAKSESSVQVVGVVREMISRFKEMR